MPYGFIKRRTFQKDPFESEAQQLHTKNRNMSRPIIHSPSMYFVAEKYMDVSTITWDIDQVETDKMIGKYRNNVFIPQGGKEYTIWELRELSQLLEKIDHTGFRSLY